MRRSTHNEFTELETIKAPGLVQISALGETRVDLSGLFDDSDQSVS